MQLNPARESRDSNQQPDDLLYLLAELQPPQISKFPECSRIAFSKNIRKMFCGDPDQDGRLRLFSAPSFS